MTVHVSLEALINDAFDIYRGYQFETSYITFLEFEMIYDLLNVMH